VSVKTPIWSWGLPLNAFKKLPLMVSRTKRCASRA
jgi:hypothetical protein